LEPRGPPALTDRALKHEVGCATSRCLLVEAMEQGAHEKWTSLRTASALNQSNVAVAITAPLDEISLAIRTSLGDTPRGATQAP
jgi:actin-like ATPase involved in cell morphogenesis